MGEPGVGEKASPQGILGGLGLAIPARAHSFHSLPSISGVCSDGALGMQVRQGLSWVECHDGDGRTSWEPGAGRAASQGGGMVGACCGKKGPTPPAQIGEVAQLDLQS